MDYDDDDNLPEPDDEEKAIWRVMVNISKDSERWALLCKLLKVKYPDNLRRNLENAVKKLNH